MKKKPDKLSQEVSMALAAGMSYGKWKAKQPVGSLLESILSQPQSLKKRRSVRGAERLSHLTTEGKSIVSTIAKGMQKLIDGENEEKRT